MPILVSDFRENTRDSSYPERFEIPPSLDLGDLANLNRGFRRALTYEEKQYRSIVGGRRWYHYNVTIVPDMQRAAAIRELAALPDSDERIRFAWALATEGYGFGPSDIEPIVTNSSAPCAPTVAVANSGSSCDGLWLWNLAEQAIATARAGRRAYAAYEMFDSPYKTYGYSSQGDWAAEIIELDESPESCLYAARLCAKGGACRTWAEWRIEEAAPTEFVVQAARLMVRQCGSSPGWMALQVARCDG